MVGRRWSVIDRQHRAAATVEGSPTTKEREVGTLNLGGQGQKGGTNFTFFVQGGGGGLAKGIFLVGNFACQFLYCVRNFPHIFQTAVRNKVVRKFSNIACFSIAFAKHSSAFVGWVQSNSVCIKPLQPQN